MLIQPIHRSNPKSSKFGKHLSADEVIDMFAPTESSVAAVSLEASFLVLNLQEAEIRSR